MKRVPSFAALAAALVLAAGLVTVLSACGTGPARRSGFRPHAPTAGGMAPAEKAAAEPAPAQPEEAGTEGEAREGGTEAERAERPSFFYFSYDDSASTASVQLAKDMVGRGHRPHPSLGRPWEFLSYEPFEPGTPETIGLFTVSMGLIRRDADYRLGVYVSSPHLAPRQRRPAVLTLVIDVSGSMNEPAMGEASAEQSLRRLDLVKYGLEVLAARSLEAGDVVNIVTFSTEAKVLLEGARFPEQSNAIRRTIASLETERDTNLGAGIEAGYRAANAHFDPDKMNRVIMLTDAFANVGEIDPAIVSEQTRRGDQEGIYFSGLGVGSGFNEAFLNVLTEAGKGAYFTLITRDDARRAFEERLIALLEVAARDVRFRLDFPPVLEREVTASEESSVRREDVRPTNFSYNTSQYFFEGFSAPNEPPAAGAQFRLTVEYHNPWTGERREETVTKTTAELLANHWEKQNIYQAEVIFLFTQLIAGEMSGGEVRAFLERYHGNYTSPVIEEYEGLIDRLAELTG